MPDGFVPVYSQYHLDNIKLFWRIKCLTFCEGHAFEYLHSVGILDAHSNFKFHSNFLV